MDLLQIIIKIYFNRLIYTDFSRVDKLVSDGIRSRYILSKINCHSRSTRSIPPPPHHFTVLIADPGPSCTIELNCYVYNLIHN